MKKCFLMLTLLYFTSSMCETSIFIDFITIIRNELDSQEFQCALRSLGSRVGKQLATCPEQKQQFCELAQAYRNLMIAHTVYQPDAQAYEVAEQKFYELCESIWPEGSEIESDFEDTIERKLSERYASRLLLLVIDELLKELKTVIE